VFIRAGSYTNQGGQGNGLEFRCFNRILVDASGISGVVYQLRFGIGQLSAEVINESGHGRQRGIVVPKRDSE